MLTAAIRAFLIVSLLVLVVLLLVPSVFRYSVAQYMYVSLDDVPKTDVALILGASVSRGRPSPILEARAQEAVQLYLRKKVSKILVTGDNGALTHDEVTPVRKYLLAAGIPEKDIFLDHAGFDTYSSMYRARDIFGATSVTVVTQDFHLPRALYIARKLGLQAFGLAAGGSDQVFYDYIREVPASVKAILDLMSSRKPKYLGPQIPLTESGTVTWY